jgi:hypothetical protein
MIPWPNKPDPMDDKVKFSFPEGLCCNCGNKEDLTIAEQETCFVRYFFWGGRTSIFHFKLPFCKNCIPPAKKGNTWFGQWLSRQPVRILKIKQEWMTGRIIGIKLGFNSGEYEKAFNALNEKAIKEK